MENADTGRLKQEFYELIGAHDAISSLKDQLDLRLEEARDECVREALA